MQPGAAGDRGEMAHQGGADALPLVLVDDGESHLGLPRLDDDVASGADDDRSPTFLHDRDQGHVIDEIDVQEERKFRSVKECLTPKKRR